MTRGTADGQVTLCGVTSEKSTLKVKIESMCNLEYRNGEYEMVTIAVAEQAPS